MNANNNNGYPFGAGGNGGNSQDDNSPNSSRGNPPSTSRVSDTVLTEVSPGVPRVGGLLNPAHLFDVATYHPSGVVQHFFLALETPDYQASSLGIPGLQVFQVEEFFTTSPHAVETRYLQINAPGIVEFSRIFKSDFVFTDAVPLSSGKEQSEYPKVVRFDSLDYAQQALAVLRGLNYEAQYLKTHDWALMKYDVVDLRKQYEGQVSIWLVCCGSIDIHDVQQNAPMRGYVYDEVSSFGKVKDVHADAWYRNCVRFRIEFDRLSDSHRCLKMMGKWLQEPHRIPRQHHPSTFLTSDNGYGWRMFSVAPYQPPTPSIIFEAPAGAFLPTFGLTPPATTGHASTGLAEVALQQPKQQTQNRVNIARIKDGLDVRTTIMLRNIPNRMDWVDLKHLLDSYCFGDYDFIYLRIDFKSCSNVGYAFINFTSPTALIRALEHIENTKWPGYHSSKRAEISYATIQGKEALVQKFRNSSVMQEPKYCRPRTFVSWLDVQNQAAPAIMTAREMEFPVPDNQAKLQRSIDNKGNVGLFPPHTTGQHHHSSNRDHSMFDKGNTKDQIATAAAAALNSGPASQRRRGGAVPMPFLHTRPASSSFNQGMPSASNSLFSLGLSHQPQQDNEQGEDEYDLYTDGRGFHPFSRRQ